MQFSFLFCTLFSFLPKKTHNRNDCWQESLFAWNSIFSLAFRQAMQRVGRAKLVRTTRAIESQQFARARSRARVRRKVGIIWFLLQKSNQTTTQIDFSFVLLWFCFFCMNANSPNPSQCARAVLCRDSYKKTHIHTPCTRINTFFC